MSSHAQTRITHDGRLLRVELRSYRNSRGQLIEREIVHHPGAVLIVPCLEQGRLVMIRNHRDAVEQTLWEFPAGKLEPDEDPAEAAGRELMEETGYSAGELHKLGEFYTSPGFTDELMHVFLASDLTLAEQQLQDDERIEVHIVDRDDIEQMIVDGSLRDGKTIAAMCQWHLWEERLKRS